VRFKPWLVWVFWVAVGILIVGTMILVAFTSPAATTVFVALTIVALLLPPVRGAIRERPDITMTASTAGDVPDERDGVRVAQVAVLLRLLNEGADALFWKVEMSSTTPDALKLHPGASTRMDRIFMGDGRVVWQAAPGEPLAHGAERQQDFLTEFFPVAGGSERAKVEITAEPAKAKLLWVDVRASRYDGESAEFKVAVLNAEPAP
jgi:hypothetical protein